MKPKLTELKGEINNSIIIVGGLKHHFQKWIREVDNNKAIGS